MQELPFLHSARRLMLVDICMKFHDASLYGLKVIERWTRWRQDFVRDKVQRDINQQYKCKSYRSCTLHVDICMKFREGSLRGFQVTERTRFVTDRRTNRRTPGEKVCLPTLKGGDIITIRMEINDKYPGLENMVHTAAELTSTGSSCQYSEPL